MANLYGAPSPVAPEPEEISSFFHHLLQNSSSSPFPSKFMHLASSLSLNPPPPQSSQQEDSAPEALDRHRVSECANFSDPGGYYMKESAENAASSGAMKRREVPVENSNNDLGDFSCDSETAEVPTTIVRPRISSKRSRAAEVHNLSEKRRRSRINEKMKALQNLIPNSNKTDKASMLDEAIEYLKQLQLQVQMLTMRNGLSLHPMYLPGVLQPIQMSPEGVSFGEGTGLYNMNTVVSTFSANEESSVQNAIHLPSQCAIPNQPVVMHSGANITSSETSLGFGPLIQVHHAPFSLATSSKGVCREGKSQTQPDTNETMKASSSGVS